MNNIVWFNRTMKLLIKKIKSQKLSLIKPINQSKTGSPELTKNIFFEFLFLQTKTHQTCKRSDTT